MAQPKAEFTFHVEGRAPCTFCGGEIMYGTQDDGEMGVLHAKPCKVFLDTELVDFMTRNRRALGIPDPDSN